jgi:hypothetical protein
MTQTKRKPKLEVGEWVSFCLIGEIKQIRHGVAQVEIVVERDGKWIAANILINLHTTPFSYVFK